MQLLGHSVDDPHNLEGGDVAGLALLDITTEFLTEKVTRPFRGQLLATGENVVGYEIHHGATTPIPGSRAKPLFGAQTPDTGWTQDSVVGVYAHALLEDTNFRGWWLSTLGVHSISSSSASATPPNWASRLDAEFDRVAQHLERTGFVDFVLSADQ